MKNIIDAVKRMNGRLQAGSLITFPTSVDSPQDIVDSMTIGKVKASELLDGGYVYTIKDLETGWEYMNVLREHIYRCKMPNIKELAEL